MADLTNTPAYGKYRDVFHLMSEDQKAFWKNYFIYVESSGCSLLNGKDKREWTDEVYLEKVLEYSEKIASKEIALEKLGIDEDEVKEIPPFSFGGFVYFDDNNDVLLGNNGVGYSNVYEKTWLLFSDEQLYLYTIKFNVLSHSFVEHCEEYFYKDIVNIITIKDEKETIKETKGGCGEKDKTIRTMITINKVRFVVPGDSIVCMVQTLDNELENKLFAAKSKIREKKKEN